MKLSCYLPWVAAQYNMEYTASGDQDPDCLTGNGDITEVTARVCRTNPVLSLIDFSEGVEAPCLLPFSLNGQIFNMLTAASLTRLKISPAPCSDVPSEPSRMLALTTLIYISLVVDFYWVSSVQQMLSMLPLMKLDNWTTRLILTDLSTDLTESSSWIRTMLKVVLNQFLPVLFLLPARTTVLVVRSN